MAHRVCPWWLGHVLINPLRRLWQDPRKILAPFVREGMTVLEPGPGMGFFTLELARLVGPSGRVVALDVQSKMLDRLKRRAEPVRPSILFFDCEDVSGIVSPRSISLEFSGGHDFNRIDPQVLQIIELRCGRSEGSARSWQSLVDRKRANVQFVDHHLIPSWGCVGSFGILRIARSYEAGAARCLECSAVRINMGEHRSRRGVRNQVAVLLADHRSGHVRTPVAIPFGEEGQARFLVVKISLN
jgi:SAM-dependent methyltransferase